LEGRNLNDVLEHDLIVIGWDEHVLVSVADTTEVELVLVFKLLVQVLEEHLSLIAVGLLASV
jgi:hypothetical protein